MFLLLGLSASILQDFRKKVIRPRWDRPGLYEGPLPHRPFRGLLGEISLKSFFIKPILIVKLD